MGLYTKAFTANAYPSRAGVSGRYPVIPPVRLPVHRLISHGICLCADFLPPANKSHVSIGKPLKLSPAFPPTSTGHATFTASGAPSIVFYMHLISHQILLHYPIVGSSACSRRRLILEIIFFVALIVLAVAFNSCCPKSCNSWRYRLWIRTIFP